MTSTPEWLHELNQRFPDHPDVPEWLHDLAERHRAKPTHTEIGEALRRAHDEGFSQEQLAIIMGSFQQNISRWMHYQ